MKQKNLRVNHGRFMRKDLHEAIMKRSRLRNKFLRDKADIFQRIMRKAKKFLC